jgi:biopolymer transport protein ExbD
MDMMTIILVFLLKSYSTSDISVKPDENLKLPVSTSQKAPELAVNLVVSQRNVVVDGVHVLNLDHKTDDGDSTVVIPEDELKGQLISSLHDRLLEKAEAAKSLGEQTGNAEFEFKGEVLMQIHKDMPFSVVRQVMYTAGQAQFGKFRFVVYKSEG